MASLGHQDAQLHGSIRARLTALQSDLYSDAPRNSSKSVDASGVLPAPSRWEYNSRSSVSSPLDRLQPGFRGSHLSPPSPGTSFSSGLGLPTYPQWGVQRGIKSCSETPEFPQTAIVFKPSNFCNISEDIPSLYSNTSTTADTLGPSRDPEEDDEGDDELHREELGSGTTSQSTAFAEQAEPSRSATGSSEELSATSSDVPSSRHSADDVVLAELQELKAMVTSIVAQRDAFGSVNTSDAPHPSCEVGNDQLPQQHSLSTSSDDDSVGEATTATLDTSKVKRLSRSGSVNATAIVAKRAPSVPPPRSPIPEMRDVEGVMEEEDDCSHEEGEGNDEVAAASLDSQTDTNDNDSQVSPTSYSSESSEETAEVDESVSESEGEMYDSSMTPKKRTHGQGHQKRATSAEAKPPMHRSCKHLKRADSVVSRDGQTRRRQRKGRNVTENGSSKRDSEKRSAGLRRVGYEKISRELKDECEGANALRSSKTAAALETAVDPCISEVPVLLINGRRFALQPSSPSHLASELPETVPTKSTIYGAAQSLHPANTVAALAASGASNSATLSNSATPLNRDNEMPDYESLRVKAMESTIESLTLQVNTLTSETDRLLSQRAQLTEELSEVSKDLETQRQLAAAQRAELDRLHLERESASQTLAADVVEIRASRDELQSLLIVQEQHLTAAHDGLDRLEEERQRLTRELTALERLDADKDALLKKAVGDEAALRQDLAAAQEALREVTARAELEAKGAEELRGKLASAQTQVEDGLSNVANLREKVAKMEIENARLAAEVEEMKSQQADILSVEEKQELLDTIQMHREKYDETQLELEHLREEVETAVATRVRYEQELMETTEEMRITLKAAWEKAKVAERERDAAIAREEEAANRRTVVDEIEMQRFRDENQRLQQRLSQLEKQMEEAQETRSASAEELQRARHEIHELKVHRSALNDVRQENDQLHDKIKVLNNTKHILERDLRSTLQASRELHQRVMRLQTSGRLLSETEEHVLRKCQRQWEAHQRNVKARQNRIRRSVVLRVHLQSSKVMCIPVGIQVGPPSRCSFLEGPVGGRWAAEDHAAHQEKDTSALSRWPSRLEHSPYSGRGASPNTSRSGSLSPGTQKESLMRKRPMSPDSGKSMCKSPGIRKEVPLYKRPTKYTTSGRLIKSSSEDVDSKKKEPTSPSSNAIPQWQQPTYSFEMRRMHSRAKIEQYEKMRNGQVAQRAETPRPVFRRNRPAKVDAGTSTSVVSSRLSDGTRPVCPDVCAEVNATRPEATVLTDGNDSRKELSEHTVVGNKGAAATSGAPIVAQQIKKMAQKATAQLQAEFSRYRDKIMYDGVRGTGSSPSSSVGDASTYDEKLSEPPVCSLRNPSSGSETACPADGKITAGESTRRLEPKPSVQETGDEETVSIHSSASPTKAVSLQDYAFLHTIPPFPSNGGAGSTTADTPDFGSLSSYRSDHEPPDVTSTKSKLYALRQRLMGQGLLESNLGEPCDLLSA